MDRYLLTPLEAQSSHERQMLFLSGPRQVGKTSLIHAVGDRCVQVVHLNWDDPDDRTVIAAGPASVAAYAGLDVLRNDRLLVTFDELHKYARWRDFLKGLFDGYQERGRFLVTGSTALTVFRRGGESLMGRYFPYTLHPLSVAEIAGTDPGAPGERRPASIGNAAWEALLRFGGFPEPFLRGEQRFYNRWRRLRTEQLLREDLRDLSRIQELDQVELLAIALTEQVSQMATYSNLAKRAQVGVETAKRWLSTLESLYYCFRVPPWHQSVARSLVKQSKYFLWDWSQVSDPGARFENLVASALRKAVDYWTESGFGSYGLYFIRDKQGNEVDFCVTRDGRPWMLVEAKLGEKQALSSALHRFGEALQPEVVLQVVAELPYAEVDAFAASGPTKVSARTFLSQLV